MRKGADPCSDTGRCAFAIPICPRNSFGKLSRNDLFDGVAVSVGAPEGRVPCRV